MRVSVLVLVVLLSCVKPPVRLTLPPPTSLPSTSLLPANPVAFPQGAGTVLLEDSVVMNPPTAAGIAAELKRLQQLGPLYQTTEREQAALVLQAQADEAQRLYKRARFYERWVPPLIVTSVVVGVATGVVLAAQVSP